MTAYRMMNWAPAALLALLATTAPAAMALNPTPAHHVVQLSASAEQEAVQDWLTVVLTHRAQAANPAAVQRQLQAALDQALRHIRPRVQAGELEMHTGGVTVQPRYSHEGQIVGWHGQAELIVQGRGVARIAATAGDTPGMAVSSMAFSLSRHARQALEAQIRSEAIGRFRQTAQQVARDFGFAGYTLREVSVTEGGQELAVRARVMMAAGAQTAMTDTPVSVEPGKTLVQVTVAGSVQLQ